MDNEVSRALAIVRVFIAVFSLALPVQRGPTDLLLGSRFIRLGADRAKCAKEA
jgi:hypothetical protein